MKTLTVRELLKQYAEFFMYQQVGSYDFYVPTSHNYKIYLDDAEIESIEYNRDGQMEIRVIQFGRPKNLQMHHNLAYNFSIFEIIKKQII